MSRKRNIEPEYVKFRHKFNDLPSPQYNLSLLKL